MQIRVLPKTLLGRWSVGLGVAFILLQLLSGILTGLGGVGPGPIGPMIGVAFGVSGIAALVTGLISVIRSKERSILVVLAMLVGLFCVFFFLGEFLFPH